jgi:hypothetical protein
MDASQIAEGLAFAKTAFDTLRGAVGLVKDVQQTLPAEKKEVISRSLEEADKQLRLAEAQFAHALGYTLCRCAYPPTPMLYVGYREITHQQRTVDVHECPVCGRDDAGPWRWKRAAPQTTHGTETQDAPAQQATYRPRNWPGAARPRSS